MILTIEQKLHLVSSNWQSALRLVISGLFRWVVTSLIVSRLCLVERKHTCYVKNSCIWFVRTVVLTVFCSLFLFYMQKF